MKRQTILPNFHDFERLCWIFRRNPDARIYTKEDHTIIYIDVKSERYISADRWKMPIDDLGRFMYLQGEQYSYISPASFGLSLYKRRFMRGNIVMPYPRSFRAVECRRALYGGRCEVFRFYKGQALQYDINSSYPYSASQLTFPDPHTIHYVRYPSMTNILETNGVSRVTFSQGGNIPVLPLRANGRVLYPVVEKQQGTYNHIELRNALANGVTIHSIEKQFIGNDLTYNPFIDFVTHCYNERVSSGLKIWKMISNGLFGRLAVINGGLLEFRPNFNKEDYYDTPKRHKHYWGAPCIARPMNAPPDANVLWAGMVLSHARGRINDIIFGNPNKILYCDTDCVFALHPLEELPVSEHMGNFKLKQGEYDIKGAKLYRVQNDEGDIIKMKGVSARHRDLSDFYAAKGTQQRIQLEDGTTVPHIITQDQNVHNAQYEQAALDMGDVSYEQKNDYRSDRGNADGIRREW